MVTIAEIVRSSTRPQPARTEWSKGATVIVVAIFSIVLSSGCTTANPAASSEHTGTVENALTYSLGASNFTINLQTPKSVSAQDIALAATTSLEVDGIGGRVIRSNSSLLSTITSLGKLQIDAGGSAGNLWGQTLVTLLPGATANGGVFTTTSPVVWPGATVKGQIVTNATFTPVNSTTWPVTFPAGVVSDFEVFGGTSTSKTPGRYGSVQVDAIATLNLTAGTYYMESLNLLPFSTVLIDQTNGPVFIYVHNVLCYSGTIVSTTGAFPDVLLAYFGVPAVTLAATFRGTFISTTGAVTLGDFTPAHVGAFFAPRITVSTGATVVYRAPANILVAAPPSGGLAACAAQIRPRDDLTGEAQADAYQADIARYCSGPGTSQCISSLTGRANVDYFEAAQQLVNQTFTPAQYLGASRDRTRKLFEANSNPTTAAAFCNGPDSDDDWVPDSQDKCPGTPALTPTDDTGCPTALPAGPDPATVHTLLTSMNILVNPLCNGAPPPIEVSRAAMYQGGNAAFGQFIMAQRITNQPAGCPVWYDFEIRELLPDGTPAGAPYDVAFKDSEETSPVVDVSGLPAITPSSPVIQFLAKPMDAGSRGQLGSVPAGVNRISFRVQAINGNGASGGWSEWKRTREEDCLALGITCTVRQ
jgi:hypothetical protein